MAFSSFSATFTHVSLRYGACQIGDHVIMTRRLVIQQVNSLFRFVLTIKHHVFKIQPAIDDDTVICIILLQSCELSDASTICQIDACRLK